MDYPTGTYPHGLAAADINHDGKVDLVTTNLTGSISVLLGKGDGTFAPAHDHCYSNAPPANPPSET